MGKLEALEIILLTQCLLSEQENKQTPKFQQVKLNKLVHNTQPVLILPCETMSFSIQTRVHNTPVVGAKNLLNALNMKPSMSRRGNCHDNAVAESFFANLMCVPH
jgi:hypothetical protein